MGVVFRQSFKSTIFLYVGVLFGVINRLFLLPYYLTFEQLGMIDALLGVSIIVSEISMLGLKGSLQKFFSIFDKKGELPLLNSITLLFPLISFSIITLCLIAFKENIISLFPKNKELFSTYYYYIIPLSLFITYKGMLTIFSANRMRLTIPTILNENFIRIVLLISLLLIGNHIIDFDIYVFLMCSAYFFAAFLMFTYCKKSLDLRFNLNLRQVPKKSYFKIINYSFFVFLMGVSNLVSQYTDSLMLASIEGFNASGIYSIAFFIGLSIEMPKRAISTISGALIAKHWNDNKPNEINKLYKQTSINQGIVGGLLFLLVVVCINEIFYLLPKSEALSIGKNVAIIIGFSRFVDMITGINSEILRTSKYYRVDFFMIIFFIGLSIFSNYILIPIYKLEGAAYATLISVALYNFIRFIVVKKLFNFNPFNLKTVYLITLLGSLLLINIFLIPTISFESKLMMALLLVIKTAIFGSIFTYLVYRLNLSVEINNLVNKLIGTIKTKLGK